MTQDLLWVALATMITPRHPFYDLLVEDAAIASDFVPLYLERNQQTIHGWQLLQTRLQPEDVLYLTIPANGLDRLWRTSDGDSLLDLLEDSFSYGNN